MLSNELLGRSAAQVVYIPWSYTTNTEATALDTIDIPQGTDTTVRSATQMEILMFSIGTKEIFGLNVFKVREVGWTPTITRTPHMPYGVEGLVSLRGLVIPVISVVSFLDPARVAETQQKTMLVVEHAHRTVGFLVEAVDRIVRVDWRQVREPEGVAKTRGNPIMAVTELPSGNLVSLLDVEHILTSAFGEPKTYPIAPLVEAGPGGIVFVDDSRIARQKIAGVFDQMGVAYHQAANGAEAWQHLQVLAEKCETAQTPLAREVRLILVDAEMPVMDGYELTRHIKADPRFTGIPVIMHSSLQTEANKAMGSAAGVDGFVAKFDAEILANTVRPLLEH